MNTPRVCKLGTLAKVGYGVSFSDAHWAPAVIRGSWVVLPGAGFALLPGGRSFTL